MIALRYRQSVAASDISFKLLTMQSKGISQLLTLALERRTSHSRVLNIKFWRKEKEIVDASRNSHLEMLSFIN